MCGKCILYKNIYNRSSQCVDGNLLILISVSLLVSSKDYTSSCINTFNQSLLFIPFFCEHEENRQIMPSAQGVAEDSVRVLVAKNPTHSFSCQVCGISFERFSWLWQTVTLKPLNQVIVYVINVNTPASQSEIQIITNLVNLNQCSSQKAEHSLTSF